MAEYKNTPMVPYVELPKFDEYKEWFKDYFDLRREDGILEVTMKTGDGPMYWSGGAHRAMSQLTRIISLDHENEVLIWTHKGKYWMKDSDTKGWDRYNDLQNAQRFQHQYFDDMNLIKNFIFDLEIPTIGAMPGPGFHWDSFIACDISIAADDAKFDDPHLHYGLVPGDGMFMLMQHLMGTKRANYYGVTCRQWTAQQALDWGWVSELVPADKVLDRAWEIARLYKSVPYETRCITAYLCKRPLARLLVEDMKLHSVNEQYSSMIKVAQGQMGGHEEFGKGQMDESYHGLFATWKYDRETKDMFEPQNLDTWNCLDKALDYSERHNLGYKRREKGE